MSINFFKYRSTNNKSFLNTSEYGHLKGPLFERNFLKIQKLLFATGPELTSDIPLIDV